VSGLAPSQPAASAATLDGRPERCIHAFITLSSTGCSQPLALNRPGAPVEQRLIGKWICDHRARNAALSTAASAPTAQLTSGAPECRKTATTSASLPALLVALATVEGLPRCRTLPRRCDPQREGRRPCERPASPAQPWCATPAAGCQPMHQRNHGARQMAAGSRHDQPRVRRSASCSAAAALRHQAPRNGHRRRSSQNSANHAEDGPSSPPHRACQVGEHHTASMRARAPIAHRRASVARKITTTTPYSSKDECFTAAKAPAQVRNTDIGVVG
jgi:hypothetical protein